MAARTFTARYPSREQAAHIVADLEAAGIPQSDIALVTDDARPVPRLRFEGGIKTAAGKGAALGGVLGGGLGLGASLGVVPMPAIGLALGVNWLVAMAAGAVMGVGLGALGGRGVGTLLERRPRDRPALAEGQRPAPAGLLVSVKADEARAPAVERVLSRAALEAAGADQRPRGWIAFDGAATAAMVQNDGEAGSPERG